MRRPAQVLLAIALLAGMAVAALPAGAKVRRPYGRIVFGRPGRRRFPHLYGQPGRHQRSTAAAWGSGMPPLGS